MSMNETFIYNYILNDVSPKVTAWSCGFNFYVFFYLFLLPILLIILGIIAYVFRAKIKEKWTIFLLKNNFIKIKIINENKNIKTKYILLDKFNNFKLKNRKYCLEDINKYIIGYEKGVPLLMFDKRFIFPLIVNEMLIEKEVLKTMGFKNKNDLNEEQKQKLKENISALYLSVDSSLLNIIYDKKLLDDLYNASGDDSLRKILIIAGIGILILIVLYYTGMLDQILGFLGVESTTPPPTTDGVTQ